VAPGERVRDKLLIVFVQTLVFGVFLAGLGYWINSRLESYKHALEVETERTKAQLVAYGSLLAERRIAYSEVRQAAKQTKQMLEGYYDLAKRRSPTEHRRSTLMELETALFPERGGGSSGGWVTRDEVTNAMRKLIALREKYEDVSSAMMNDALEEFINTLIDDLKKSADKSTKNERFHNAAWDRQSTAYDKFMGAFGKEVPLQ